MRFTFPRAVIRCATLLAVLLVSGIAAAHAGALDVLRVAALSGSAGRRGNDPLTSCADDGVCNVAVCGIDKDPDCRPDNCNADGRCVSTCAADPDCKVDGPPEHDERVVVKDPAQVPFKAIAKVDIGPDGGGRGSAVLVGPCTLLTNGHVVYNRKTQRFRSKLEVHPGSYYDEDRDKAVDPFGSRDAVLLATNTSWENTGEGQYDYGAIFLDRKFEHIASTLIPLEFGFEPVFINMSGYPSEALPSDRAGAEQEQWRGSGDVSAVEERLLRYEARSTGGASGSPVWTFSAATDTRRLVGLNRAHSGATGIGVRLTSHNQGLITKWAARPCEDDSRRSARMSFSRLKQERRTLQGEPIAVRDPAALGLVTAPAAIPAQARARTVVQWIEGELYRWEEYVTEAAIDQGEDGGVAPAGATASPKVRRYIRLLEPEARPLAPDEAAVLLGASATWQRSAPSSPVYYTPPASVHPVQDEPAPRRGPAAAQDTELLGRP